ncbi:hypothetical protein BY458DRAFT_419170, partial [Sporodiniella umbellata]
MVQSQIVNVLPRQILARLWTTSETRLTLSHFAIGETIPKVMTPQFLCSELPVRYTHILRLLASFSPEALHTPLLRQIAQSYLQDICTLLHPSLGQTSPRAFSTVLQKLRSRQALCWIRLGYAFAHHPQLLENIQTVGIGIHLLLDQHISWASHRLSHLQSVHPESMVRQVVRDAQQAFTARFPGKTPEVTIRAQALPPVDTLPSVLYRILYETCVIQMRAHVEARTWREARLKWYERPFFRPAPLTLSLFGAQTSLGLRLATPALVSDTDLASTIPHDLAGWPSAHAALANPHAPLEAHAMTGWRAARLLARYWGGHLESVVVPGLGSTAYLALDRNLSLPELDPPRSSPPLPLHTARSQLDHFLHRLS